MGNAHARVEIGAGITNVTGWEYPTLKHAPVEQRAPAVEALGGPARDCEEGCCGRKGGLCCRTGLLLSAAWAVCWFRNTCRRTVLLRSTAAAAHCGGLSVARRGLLCCAARLALFLRCTASPNFAKRSSMPASSAGLRQTPAASAGLCMTRPRSARLYDPTAVRALYDPFAVRALCKPVRGSRDGDQGARAAEKM